MVTPNSLTNGRYQVERGLPWEITGILVATKNVSKIEEDIVVYKFWITIVESSTPPSNCS